MTSRVNNIVNIRHELLAFVALLKQLAIRLIDIRHVRRSATDTEFTIPIRMLEFDYLNKSYFVTYCYNEETKAIYTTKYYKNKTGITFS